METNRLIIALLFLASLLGAQEYYVKKDNGEPRIYQRLAWQADENALRYEVVIEQPAEEAYTKRYVEIKREFTEDTFIEVSLSPGKYRYRVTAYDFLDRPGIPSEWAALEILQAQVPELLDFSPGVFYLDGDPPWVISVTGRNVSEGAEVYLQHQRKGSVIVPREAVSSFILNVPAEAAAVEGDSPVEEGAESSVDLPEDRSDGLSDDRPAEQDREYQQFFWFFDTKQLAPGNYRLYIKNPGGFEASGGPFDIGFNPKSDIYISLAYTPLIPSFVGAAARFGMVPLKKTFGFFGAELSVNWHYLTSRQLIGAELSILYQKWLSGRNTAFTVRAGGGMAATAASQSSESETDSESMDTMLPLAKVGPGFLWLINKRFFMEAGIDVIFWFTGKSTPGFIRPWLAGGIKL